MIAEMIFVYNADSGALNAAFDIAHKIISPKTYKCSLCSLTFDTFSENKQWTKFRDSSQSKMTFLHKDEFENKYKAKFQYPVVLKKIDNTIDVLLSADEINAFADLNDLIAELKQKT